jgi:glycosyltransferase involved in cell wall biosynthesis
LLSLEIAIPHVSVIVPVYNTAPYLAIALESIISQSLREIEIIVVDDGSTDESLAITRSYARDDARIVILTQENKGQGAARNAGLEAARGTYVYFFDSDDLLKPGVLRRLYATCERNQLDLCLFSGTVIYDRPDYAITRKNQEKYNLREGHYEGVYDGQALYSLLIRNGDHCASAPLLFIRRSYLIEKSITFAEDIIHEDESYVFEVIVRAARASVITDQLYIRRIRPGSTMTRLNIARSITGNQRTIELMDEIVSTLDAAPQEWLRDAVESWQTRLRNNIVRLTDEQTGRQSRTKVCPRVSVIVFCPGDPSGLDASLSTLTGQTLREIEIICVDTGTNEATSRLLEEYAATDHRLRVIALKGASRGAAFEAGAASANGEYLSFMEAGDFAALDCYERLFGLGGVHEANAVLSDLYLYTINDEANGGYGRGGCVGAADAAGTAGTADAAGAGRQDATGRQDAGCSYQETLRAAIPASLMEVSLRREELPEALLTEGLHRGGIFKRALFSRQGRQHGQQQGQQQGQQRSRQHDQRHDEQHGHISIAVWWDQTDTVCTPPLPALTEGIYCTKEASIRHRPDDSRGAQTEAAC